MHELRCLSSHRCEDGAVCPACRLASQASWFNERLVADDAIKHLGLTPKLSLEGIAGHMLKFQASGLRDLNRAAGRIAVAATILTYEDADQGSLTLDPHAEAEAVLLVYVDVIRTLASSLRRVWRTSSIMEPFLLVLLSLPRGDALPLIVQTTLNSLENTGLIRLKTVVQSPPQVLPSLWGKLQLWLLQEYQLVLYFDADTLIVGSIDELVERIAPVKDIAFAAALARSGTSVNTGVMLLRPSIQAFDAMLQSYNSRSMWTGQSRWSGQTWNMSVAGAATPPITSAAIMSALRHGVHPPVEAWPQKDGANRAVGGEASSVSGSWRADLVEQDWRNEFIAVHMVFRGELRLTQLGQEEVQGTPCDAHKNSSSRCAAEAPTPCDHRLARLSSYLLQLEKDTPITATTAWGQHAHAIPLGEYCTLPMTFNFCVTAPCLEYFTDTARPAELQEEPRAAAKDVRVLHWPGSLRKPWQRCSLAARSEADSAWWRTYMLACASAPAGAPCHIRC